MGALWMGGTSRVWLFVVIFGAGGDSTKGSLRTGGKGHPTFHQKREIIGNNKRVLKGGKENSNEKWKGQGMQTRKKL